MWPWHLWDWVGEKRIGPYKTHRGYLWERGGGGTSGWEGSALHSCFAKPQPLRARLMLVVLSLQLVTQPYVCICVCAHDSESEWLEWDVHTKVWVVFFLCENACAVWVCAECSMAQMCVGGWVGALGDGRCSSLFLIKRIRLPGQMMQKLPCSFVI